MFDAGRLTGLLLGSVAVAALAVAVPATAQVAATKRDLPAKPTVATANPLAAAAPATGASSNSSDTDIIVTGSRIVRNGNDAPVPTTVLTVQEIQQRGVANIADYITELPALGRGNTPRTTTLFANATGGANQLSARDLGVDRTLVLLDGRQARADNPAPVEQDERPVDAEIACA